VVLRIIVGMPSAPAGLSAKVWLVSESFTLDRFKMMCARIA